MKDGHYNMIRLILSATIIVLMINRINRINNEAAAVKSGVAEYTADENGYVKFVYKKLDSTNNR